MTVRELRNKLSSMIHNGSVEGNEEVVINDGDEVTSFSPEAIRKEEAVLVIDLTV